MTDLRPSGTPTLASLDDLPELVALDRDAFGDHAWTEAQLRSQLVRPDGVALVLHRDGGGLRGACLGWVAGGVGELLRMAVHSDARRRGHGGRLLTGFLGHCTARGGDELWLELRADNAPALALYQAHGFTITGRRPRYYGDGTDAVLMTWRPPRSLRA